jgi:hypothetical protein
VTTTARVAEGVSGQDLVDPGCSDRSRDRGEPCAGTASRARRWLLVEQPGPWGADALTASDLPAEVATHLAALARSLPARVLLLRRPGGAARPGTVRDVLVASSRPAGGGWVERFELPHVRDLLRLDLRPLSDGHSVGGEPLDDPVYLVCTNGKHDACCARYGLPVARALGEELGDQVWECSHVGGDRFAGNVVCLPSGVLYGHLDPDTALRAVAADRAGRIEPTSCRGRTALSFPHQAAELALRRELDLFDLAAVRHLGGDRDGDHHRVRFGLVDGRRAVVTVHAGRSRERQVLTCGTEPMAPPVHTIVDIEVVAPPGS